MAEEVFATPDDDAMSHGLVRQRGDQPSKPPPVPEASLDDSSVQPQHAFEVFAGKVYQTHRSDKRSNSTVSGSSSGNGWSLLVASGVGGRSSVTKGIKASTDPVSRYFRLRAELEDLETDLAVLNNTNDGSASNKNEPAVGADGASSRGEGRSSDVLVALRNELVAVRQRLNQAGAAPALRTLVGGNNAAIELGLPQANSGEDGSGGASAALLAAVENLKVAAQEAGISKSSEGTGGSGTEVGGNSRSSGSTTGATFELYVNPSSANDESSALSEDSKGAPATTSRAARVAALEERMARVESAVGGPTDDGGSAGGLVGRIGRGTNSSSGSHASLSDAIATLEARVARLEPETIAKAREELQPLQAALEQVLQEQKACFSGGSDGKTGSVTSKSGDDSIGERSAVVSLFQRTQAIDDYGPMLPGLIARLRSLQGVHEASIGVINRLSALEQSRRDVTSAATRDREALALLASNLSENLSQVTENVAAVDARIAALAL